MSADAVRRARSGVYDTSMMHIAPETPVEQLLEVNTARIKNDFIDRVVESRRQLEAVKERLAWLDGHRASVDALVTPSRSGSRARAPS